MGKLVAVKKTPVSAKAKNVLKPKPLNTPLPEAKSEEIIKKKKLNSLHIVHMDRDRNVESATSGKSYAYANKLLSDISDEHNEEHELKKDECMHYSFQGATVGLFQEGLDSFQNELAQRTVLGAKFSKTKTISPASVINALNTDIHGGQALVEGGNTALALYDEMFPPTIRERKAPKPITKARPKKEKDVDAPVKSARGRKPKAVSS
jgi:hypothetical protein